MRLSVLLICTATFGCGEDEWAFVNMRKQPSFRYLEASRFFDDGSSARPLPPGVVPRTALPAESAFAIEFTPEALSRGQLAFRIYCSVCHGADGYGRGMVVQRGFPAPPSMHEERLRAAEDRHFLDVMNRGLGKMPSYSGQTSPRQRADIVAYIRALQRSQHARLADVPEAQQVMLERAP